MGTHVIPPKAKNLKTISREFELIQIMIVLPENARRGAAKQPGRDWISMLTFVVARRPLAQPVTDRATRNMLWA
jgi:hypothetical protein